MLQLHQYYTNSWALIIGVNEYLHLGPLEIACSDATSIRDILMSELGFPESNVRMLLNKEASRKNIMNAFLAFESVGPDDRLVIFFAGHGMSVEGHRGSIGYLIPADGSTTDKSTLIRWDELTRNAEIIPAKHILFVMDACYSGLAIQRRSAGGERRFVSDMLRRRSRQVIAAGKADEAVADSGGPNGANSIFTGHLLEGLRGAAATPDGVLTASQLMSYAYHKVGSDSRSQQTPHFGHLEGDGDFILRTPGNEHLNAAADADFILQPVVERPEPEPQAEATPKIRPAFAAKNGYADPESASFGRNEWSGRLGEWEFGTGTVQRRAAFGWLALVVEPVSALQNPVDLAGLAKTLRNHTVDGANEFQQFQFPRGVMTTANSVILYEPDASNGTGIDCWKRFLRVDRTAAIEFCEYQRVGRVVQPNQNLPTTINVFMYRWSGSS